MARRKRIQPKKKDKQGTILFIALLLAVLFVAGLCVWEFGGGAKAILSRMAGHEDAPKQSATMAKASTPERPSGDIFLDREESLTGLFRLFERDPAIQPPPATGCTSVWFLSAYPLNILSY